MTIQLYPVLIVVPPTLGHFSTAIALAQWLNRAHLASVILTGTEMQAFQSVLPAGIRLETSPSHNLASGLAASNLAPHLVRVADPDYISSAYAAQMQVATDLSPVIIIGKDSFAAVATAASLNIPYVGFYSDGFGSWDPVQNAQSVPAAVLRQAADRVRNVAVHNLDPTRPLAGRTLNLVRGFHTLMREETICDPRVSMLGFMGGASDMLGSKGLQEAPDIFVSFGTVWRSQEPFQRVVDVARKLRSKTFLLSAGGPRLASSLGLSKLPTNVDLVDYVAASQILPRARATVHHGGHGLHLAAARARIGSVIWPQNPRTQQAAHGTMVEAARVGVLLNDSSAMSGDNLARAISQVLEERVEIETRWRRLDLEERSAKLEADALSRIRRAICQAAR